MTIDERKRRLLRDVDRLTISSGLKLEANIEKAKTHADLDRIADDLDSADAEAEESELFGGD